MYNLTYAFSTSREDRRKYTMKSKKKKTAETEWVPCSEDWRDSVITYVPELNDMPIEDNYADISWEKSRKHINDTREKHR